MTRFYSRLLQSSLLLLLLLLTLSKEGTSSEPWRLQLSNASEVEDFQSFVDRRLSLYCYCPFPSMEDAGILQDDLGHARVARAAPPPMPPLPNKTKWKRKKLRDRPPVLLSIRVADDIHNFRVVHGIGNALATLWFTPLSIFLTRHGKENMMQGQVMYRRVWYSMHLLLTFLTFHCHLVGWTSNVFGSNLAGKGTHDAIGTHKSIGYVAIALFLLTTALGGIRPFNKAGRWIGMLIHFLMGLGYYVACLMAMITSEKIIGSPSAPQSYDLSFYKIRHSSVVRNLVIIWAATDLGFHIVMEILQRITDYRVGIKRVCHIIFIPVLYEYNTMDLIKGMLLKEVLMFIYFLTCSCFTMAVIAALVESGSTSTQSDYVKNSMKTTCILYDKKNKAEAFDMQRLTNCDFMFPFMRGK